MMWGWLEEEKGVKLGEQNALKQEGFTHESLQMLCRA